MPEASFVEVRARAHQVRAHKKRRRRNQEPLLTEQFSTDKLGAGDDLLIVWEYAIKPNLRPDIAGKANHPRGRSYSSGCRGQLPVVLGCCSRTQEETPRHVLRECASL